MGSRIAWKPFGDFNTASSRYRAYFPCRSLKNAGWNCEIFSEENLDTYQLVILQKTYMDDRDIELALHLKNRGVITVLDLCDNDFYNPNSYPIPAQLANRLSRLVEIVDFVSVSTPEIGKLVSHKQWMLIDDFLEIPKNSLFENINIRSLFSFNKRSEKIKLVWYGNNRREPFMGSSTGIIELQRILPHLANINKKYPLSLTVISDSKELFNEHLSEAPFEAIFIPWNRKTFSRIFRQHDVCIIPITVDPFTICKTSNRLVLSLLLGVPVVADKIPSYDEFNDFVFFSAWENAIPNYALNPDLRRKHTESGKQYILERFSEEKIVEQWSCLFKNLLKVEP